MKHVVLNIFTITKLAKCVQFIYNYNGLKTYDDGNSVLVVFL